MKFRREDFLLQPTQPKSLSCLYFPTEKECLYAVKNLNVKYKIFIEWGVIFGILLHIIMLATSKIESKGKPNFFGEIYFPSKSEQNYLIEVCIFRNEGYMVLKFGHPKIWKDTLLC